MRPLAGRLRQDRLTMWFAEWTVKTFCVSNTSRFAATSLRVEIAEMKRPQSCSPTVRLAGE